MRGLNFSFSFLSTPDENSLIRYKKGGSTTNVQSYTPTAQEIRLQEQAADYSEAVAPNALWLNNLARKMAEDSFGAVRVDYNQLNQNAQNQITAAQKGVAGLTSGILPAEFQTNAENAIRSGVENTLGDMVNNLGARGVLSSSVANTALDNISDSVTDTMAGQYNDNIGLLNGLYGQQASLAGQGTANAAAAQEAAAALPLQWWNASTGLNSGGTLGALNAVAGQGTTTSTQSSSGGGGLFSGLFNGAVGAGISAAYCFADDTKVATPDGEKYIRHLNKGDVIVSYNAETGERTEEEILEIMKPQYAECYVVVCADEKGGSHYVSTTLTQPLMLADGEFKDVAVLRIGDNLKEAGKVRGIVLSGERKVYDLKVTGNNTYYANGFIAKGGTNEW